MFTHVKKLTVLTLVFFLLSFLFKLSSWLEGQLKTVVTFLAKDPMSTCFC